MYFSLFKCIGLFVWYFSSALLVPCSAEPLLLTPLIESNRTEEARNQSQVRDLPDVSGVLSYSGYLTVNKMKHNLFFWYFPAMEADPAGAPVIIWLSGGPGWSGLNAVFVENGPFIVDANGSVTLRNETWTKQFSVVFMDQPLGTGFSYADGGDDYINDTDVADIVTQDMVEFVQQFLRLYELEGNDLYISGQSYGGKYTTRLAAALLQNSSSLTNKSINLKGITIGNGFLDNSYLTDNSDFLYQHGLITTNQKNELEEMQATCKKLVEANDLLAAANLMDSMLLGYFHQPTFIANCTDDADPSNLMRFSSPKTETNFVQYVSRKDVRTAIHVIDREFSTINLNVTRYMLVDFPVQVSPQLFGLVNNSSDLKILIYNGELDLICPYVITEEIFLRDLPSFANATRVIWKINPSDQEVAGFVTQPTSKLWVAMVRGGGHSAPEDEPKRCLDLVTRFIKDVPI